jgi:hypothetical protein
MATLAAIRRALSLVSSLAVKWGMNKDSENVRRKAEETNTVQLNDAPRWSPWNFQNTKRDWHRDIYDETSPC